MFQCYRVSDEEGHSCKQKAPGWTRVAYRLQAQLLQGISALPRGHYSLQKVPNCRTLNLVCLRLHQWMCSFQWIVFNLPLMCFLCSSNFLKWIYITLVSWSKEKILKNLALQSRTNKTLEELYLKCFLIHLYLVPLSGRWRSLMLLQYLRFWVCLMPFTSSSRASLLEVFMLLIH